MKSKYLLTLLLISVSLILSIVSISATTISNSPSQYLTADNFTLNGTGYYYNGQGVSSGTADVVVCRGTNVLDDLYKSIKFMSGCDVVCKSTSSDCSSILQNSISSNKNIVWASGNYPINLPASGTAIDITSSNFTLNAYGVVLSVTFGFDHDEYAIYLHQTNNVNILGLSIIGNLNCNSANTCYGILAHHNSNTYYQDLNIKGIKGFPITLSDLGGATNNVIVYHSYFEGAGVADAFGAGANTPNNLNNVQVISCIVNQTSLNGTTDTNAIVFSGGNNILIKDTTTIGSLVFGSEHQTTNSKFINNNVYPVNASNYPGYISISNQTDYNLLIQDNNVYNGAVSLQGNMITFDNNYINTTNISYSGIVITSSNDTITNNKIYGGLYGIDISANSNSLNIKNNRIEGANSYYIRATNSQDNDISSNNFIKNDAGGNYAIIHLVSFVNSSFNNNNLYNFNTASDYFAISSGCGDLTLTNNQVFENKTFSDEYASVNAGALNSTYVDKKTNYACINCRPCSATSVFDGRMIENGTNACFCTGGSWKCWAMS